MRYRFVDCRWDIADAARGPASSTSTATSPARRSSTSTSISPRAPGARGRHPLPERGAVRRRGVARRHRPRDVFVVAYGNMGGAERLWWLLRHFGHDACAVHRPRGVARSASRRRGGDRAGGVRPAARAPTTRSRPTSSRRGSASSSSSTRACRSAGAASRNPIDRVPGPDPRRAERALERAAARAPRGRARRLLRLGRHRVRDAAPARARRPRGQALSGLVVRVGAAPRAAGRARLGEREDDADARR